MGDVMLNNDFQNVGIHDSSETVKMNPKREVRTTKYKMRIVGAGKGKGSYKRQKSNIHQWTKVG